MRTWFKNIVSTHNKFRKFLEDSLCAATLAEAGEPEMAKELLKKKDKKEKKTVKDAEYLGLKGVKVWFGTAEI